MQLFLSLLETEIDDNATTLWKAQSTERRAEALTVLARMIAKAVEAPSGSIAKNKEQGHE
jgi:hypothetical protein